MCKELGIGHFIFGSQISHLIGVRMDKNKDLVLFGSLLILSLGDFAIQNFSFFLRVTETVDTQLLLGNKETHGIIPIL